MKKISAISAIRFAICLGALGAVFWLTGCTETSTVQQPAPGVLTADIVSQQKPLPPKALVKFAQLKPAIATPKNIPYSRELHPNATKAIAAAAVLVKKKDLPGAIEKLQRAQGFDPANPQIHRLLGEVYFSMGDFTKAYENLTLASKYLSDDIALQLGLGRTCVVQKKYDLAIRHFRTALVCSNAKELGSDYAIGLLFLYRLLDAQGYWTAAAECNERLSVLLREHSRNYYDTPGLQNVLMNPEVLLTDRSRLLLKLHKTREAAVVLDKAYRRDRSNEKTAELLLQVRIHNKQHTEGEDLVVSLAELDTPIDSLPTLTRSLCISSGDPATVKRIWERLHKQSSAVSPELKIALIESLLKMGADEDARELLENLWREAPSNLQAATMLAVIDAKNGESLQGLRRLGKLVANTSQAPPDLLPVIKKIISAGSATPPDLAQQFGAETYRDMSDEKYALHYVAGLLAQHSGNQFLAADHFKRSIDAKKDFYPAYDALLGIRMDGGQSQQVSAILDQIQNQARKGFYYHFMLGKVRLEQGKLSEAVKALETAQQQNESHIPTLLKLAGAYQLAAARKNDDSQLLQSASETLRLSLGLDPRREDIYRLLFDCYVRQGDVKSARRVAGRAVRELPKKPLGRQLAAEAYMLAGENKTAAKIIQNLKQQYPNDPDVGVLQVRNQLSRHPGVLPKTTYEKLAAQLEGLYKKHPNNVRVQRVLAQLYDMSVPGWHGAAADIWEKLWQQHPQDVNYGKALGVALFKAGQYKRLVPVARKLVKQMPRNETMRTMLTEALLKNGQVDEAIKLASAWWKRDKRNFAYVGLLFNIYTESQRFADGAKFVHKLRDYAGNRFFSLESLQGFEMEFLAKAKSYDKLIKIVAEADSPNALTLAACFLIKEKHPEAAVAMLEKMLPPPPTTKPTTQPTSKPTTEPATKPAKQKSDDESLEMLLGTYIGALVEAGELDKAQAFAKQYPMSSKLGRDVHRALISSMIRKNPILAGELLAEYHDELPKYLKSDKLAKALKICEFQQYHIFIAEQKYAEAVKIADEHLGKDPKNMLWLRFKLRALNEQGDMLQATKLSKQIYEQNRNNPEWQNNYAYQLAELGVNLGTAEKLVRKSLKQAEAKQGEAPLASLDTLGWVLYKQGKLSEAGKVFENILERIHNSSSLSFVDESDPVMWDHAGDVLYRLGWKKHAVEYWAAAVKEAKVKIEEFPQYAFREILANTPGKIEAVKAGRPAEIAPLGKKTRHFRAPKPAAVKTNPGEVKKSPTITPGDKQQ
ncbi:MAG: tetratricopeptide repeat protein [Phycisphaerae bacterium]|nr:tetratricopeptide repeat protein [Phycisphaerae bacterium]